jgi:hypothetical protein
MYWLAPVPNQGCPSTAVAAHYSSSSTSSSGVRRRRHGTAALWLVKGRDGVKVTRLCADVTDELTAAVCAAVELSGAVSVPPAKQQARCHHNDILVQYYAVCLCIVDIVDRMYLLHIYTDNNMLH